MLSMTIICIGVGVTVDELVGNLPDFHHVNVLPTCQHINTTGASILLGLVVEFLILIVISEPLVDVCHHVVTIGVGADVVVAELVKFVGGFFLHLNIVVVGDATEKF